MTPTAVPITPVPEPPAPQHPNVPITHAHHPFWIGFSWGRAAQVLQAAAVIAPVFVAVLDKGDPNAAIGAKQLGDLVSAIIGQFTKGDQ